MNYKSELNEQTQQILKGLEKSYQNLVEYKKYKNTPLIVSKNGKVIEIKPEDLEPTTQYIVG